MLKTKAICMVCAILLALPCLLSFTYHQFDVRDKAHEIAQLARSIGLPEDDPIIVRAKELWLEANEQFQRDRDIIATVVYNEAGYGCSDRHMELVAAVIYNRLRSDKFPDTVYEIVTAPKQYHPLYADPDSFYSLRAQVSDKWARCQKIATMALQGSIECPENVFYQANFEQGDGIYETHETSYSTTWFCYDEEVEK